MKHISCFICEECNQVKVEPIEYPEPLVKDILYRICLDCIPTVIENLYYQRAEYAEAEELIDFELQGT
jgi:hypothetical protein